MREVFARSCLWLAVSISAVPALAQGHPWQTLLDAAIEAQMADDLPTAEALAKAALEVALQVDEKQVRPNLTRLVLQMIYVEMDQSEKARAVTVPRLDVSTFDPALLPVARSFEKLAIKYYDRFRAEQDQGKRMRNLAVSERAMLLRWAIQSRLLVETGMALAATMVSQAAVFQQQGKLPEMIEKYEAAEKIWKELEERDHRLSVSSQFSLAAGRTISTFGTKTFEDPYFLRFLLARAYSWRAQASLEAKKTSEAAADFQRSKEMLLGLTRLMDQHWPAHSFTGSGYLELARVYSYENRYRESQEAYRKALDIFAGQHGPQANDSRRTARELAAVLRKDNQESEAERIEARYGAKD